MIERYSLPEMREIWEINNKYQFWLEVELAACRAHNKFGNIPDDALREIESKASFSIDRIDEIEEEVKHDVIAFVTSVNENVGEASRYIHMGLTSSDVLDTALALQLKKANTIIEKDIKNVIKAIKNKIKEHKNTITIGRSHGIHAEPTTFGLKLGVWLDIFERNLERFNRAADDINVGQISGPVGTYSNIDPKIEELVCEELGLKPAKISTQVIQRDLHAYYLQTLALIATTIEQFSTEIRHLQRTEVLEVEEGFSKGQKGSSAMPHKKNPISSENLSGLARVIRANSIAALENVVLWHERDISHSSVERIIMPDSTILMNYMLNRFKDVVENLQVYPENMLANTQLYGGVIYSQRVMLALTNKGLSREDAYRLVQENAHKAWNVKGGSFKDNLLNDDRIRQHLNEVEIEECFDPNYYLRNINTIYERLGV
ncbi:MAG: adenylosuccinate lyase [Candidatus Melainabacteria bacterium RIFOXYA12_FULL_32_12]|nr:MAG: adenylosuccinate lyase [Candidatus Melainabacteria bacterium RIFOXYA12_FULL_32_12]